MDSDIFATWVPGMYNVIIWFYIQFLSKHTEEGHLGCDILAEDGFPEVVFLKQVFHSNKGVGVLNRGSLGLSILKRA